MQSNATALVLGATGGIGGEIARKLLSRGWTVKALHRQREGADAQGLTWIKGDALSENDVVSAAEGAALIVHAVNPPGYRNWATLVLPMLNATIAAAERAGSRIVLPGTVYNFGPDALPNIDEDSPQHAVTRKGAIRVEMERRLREASERGAKVLIVRAGDYFGPSASANSWFAQLAKPGKPLAAISYPGKTGIGHQWAYLPDVAETMMQLIERADELPALARFHCRGHWDRDGTEMIRAIRSAIGKPALKVRKLPWALITLLSPVVPLFRELGEMRYLWNEPVFMNNQRLVAFLGAEPHTPLGEAVRATLAGQGIPLN